MRLPLVAVLAVTLTGCTPDAVVGTEAGGAGGMSSGSTGATASTGSSSTSSASTSNTGAGSTSASSASSAASTGSMMGPTCGNDVLEAGEVCDDGNTASNDGCDADCVPRGDTCSNPIAVTVPLGELTVTGSTAVGAHTPNPTGCANVAGHERWFKFTPTTSGFLTVWTAPSGTSYNAVIYALPQCGDPSTYCANNEQGAPDVLSFRVAGAPVLFAVDGSSSGAFELHVDLSKGDDCMDPIPLPVGDPTSKAIEVVADTTGLMNDNDSGASAMGGCGGTVSPDVVYHVLPMTNLNTVDVTVDGVTTAQPAVYARAVCTDHIIGQCGGTPVPGGTASDTFPAPLGGTYLWVDSANSSSGEMLVTVKP